MFELNLLKGKEKLNQSKVVTRMTGPSETMEIPDCLTQQVREGPLRLREGCSGQLGKM